MGRRVSATFRSWRELAWRAGGSGEVNASSSFPIGCGPPKHPRRRWLPTLYSLELLSSPLTSACHVPYIRDTAQSSLISETINTEDQALLTVPYYSQFAPTSPSQRLEAAPCSETTTTTTLWPCEIASALLRSFCLFFIANICCSSPQGRIFQVEYAQEAVKQGSVVVGIVSKTHAVLVGLKVGLCLIAQIFVDANRSYSCLKRSL